MPRLKRILVALAVASTAALGSAQAASAYCPGSDHEASALTTTQIEESVLCLVNDQRIAAGLEPLWPNWQLRSAGVRHSSEMVSQGYFAHTSPQGVDFIQRIADAGYTRARRTKSWVLGENLGWGSARLGTANQIVTAWMNSPPHRANIMRGRFRELGVAAVKGTPVNASDPNGVTVSTEYGFRAKKKRKKKA